MVADVEVDVEVGILEPVRQIEAERHLDQASTKRGQQVDAFEDGLLGRLEPGAAGRAGGVVDVERGHMTKSSTGLHVQEARIDAVQLTHEATVSRAGSPGHPVFAPMGHHGR